MAWKGLHISQPARLSLKQGQLLAEREAGPVSLPLEDIAWIILEHHRVTLSHALIAQAMEQGIALITCDKRHMPSGLLLPFQSHHRQAAVANLQLSASEALKKRLWQAIVQQKITNQAQLLEQRGLSAARPLRGMVKLVGSGDPTNVEARAAQNYWPTLFEGFVRSNEADWRNKALNYGYAVLRAVVARALVAHGLLPCLGLHHASDSNAFNLADDMIEPFRPFADQAVAQLLADKTVETAEEAAENSDLTLEQRQSLANLPLARGRFGSESFTLLLAAEKLAASLVRALENKTAAALELPSLSPETT